MYDDGNQKRRRGRPRTESGPQGELRRLLKATDAAIRAGLNREAPRVGYFYLIALKNRITLETGVPTPKAEAAATTEPSALARKPNQLFPLHPHIRELFLSRAATGNQFERSEIADRIEELTSKFARTAEEDLEIAELQSAIGAQRNGPAEPTVR